MIKERILFIGVGQAGGNIVNEMEKKGYYTAYINTSSEDLSTLETDDSRVFHIPSTTGCSKNKQKARIYVNKYYEGMLNFLESTYPKQDIVFFVQSAGGGTGAGIGPALADYLSKHYEKKHYGMILALPSEHESNKVLENALGTYGEISGFTNIKSVFILDNSKGDKLALNAKFARAFDKFIQSGSPDIKGNIDSDEIETLLTTPGYSTILPVSEDINSQLFLVDDVFASYVSGCDRLGIICKSEKEENEIREVAERELGVPYDTFTGYSDINMVIATGMCYPDYMVDVYEETILSRRKEQENTRRGAVRIKSSLLEKDEKSRKHMLNSDIITEKPKNTKKDAAAAFKKWL